ncbi:MAG: hypothetical protein PVI87_09735, partial [Gammaproteobacteria bacterium]
RAGELLAALEERLAPESGSTGPAALAWPAATQDPAALAQAVATACPDTGTFYLLLPGAALEAVQRRGEVVLTDGGERDGRSWWAQLLALAAADPRCSLVPEAPGPGVTQLAPGHAWAGPSPGAGELIPAAARRLRVPLDFGTLLAAAGERPAALGGLASDLVIAADRRLGPQAGGARRLALELEGIARAAVDRGRDPRSFATLCWLKRLLAAFRDGACAASVRLAREQGTGGGLEPFPLPGRLEVAEAAPRERAVLAHGARHSHLVCLSPWSLAPPELGREAFGLLPALACADSIGWRRPPGGQAGDWYGEALRFAWAVALRS